jgi:SAM-dependent methyltransferase
MNIKHSLLRPLAHAVYNRGPVGGVLSYMRVVREFISYRRQTKETVRLADFFPWPIDRYDQAGDAGMYFYQDAWCASHIKSSAVPRHVDVGSSMMFVSTVLQMCELVYVDLRPITINLPTFRYQQGDLTNLPFENGSIESLSSLSVVEHVGLGRYGDKLDPSGTDTACRELARVLAPGGSLYVAVPTAAKNSTCFNAHRIFAPDDFIVKFPGLSLREERYALQNGTICRCEYDRLNLPFAFGCFRFSK